MKTLLTLCMSVVSLSLLSAQSMPTFSPDDVDIPYKKYVLDNGLRLIVHEDHKAPIVAVNVWYHVGSKNEKPGKSGFAHLFEHLMFNGSENFDKDYFEALERMGATDFNGTTNTDRTNYFENVPVEALDQVLWLESDRMGHLLGAITQEKLDEQRGVVQNEKRQGENQPYGRQYDLITKAMFPKGHPYSWTVIGEMEDLNAASLEDVKEWFQTYYGAANAVLSIVGDVDPEEVHRKVIQYFGDIPSGPTLARYDRNIPIRNSDTRQSYQDRVPETRIVQVWNTPEVGSLEDTHMDLIATILSAGKNARLYKKLRYEDQSATGASAFQSSSEIASNFYISVNVKPGNDPAAVEATTNQILAEFLENGPTEAELQRAKANYYTNLIKGIERIGGFGGKSDILARNEVYFGDPGYYKKQLEMVAGTSADDLKQTARKWLSNGKHTLIAEPFPDYGTIQTGVDRSKLPEMGNPAPVKFPELQQATLANGMKVVLAQREGVPTIVMNMLFDAGYSSDEANKAGLANLAMNMMDEGTESMNSLEINEQLQLLGASISTSSDLDLSYVNMNTLKASLRPSLDLYAEVVRSPAFPESEFDRLKNEQIGQIKREKANPVQMAIRVMPKYLYGEGHAYSMPLTGSGFEESVASLERDDVMAFHQQWIRPNNATLIVVGDVGMDELVPQLEASFGDWKKGSTPQKKLAMIDAKKGGKLYLMDRPESQQSVILGGYLIEPYGKVPEIARETLIRILGGDFGSRLNMNLREDKHWAYGAFALVPDAKGQRPLIAYAPVQTDKTKESIAEIIKEFNMINGDKPVSEEEFSKTTTNTILQLPGQWETNSAVASSLNEQIKYNLPDDYFHTYDQQVRNLSLEDVRQLSNQLVRDGDLLFFVVGDKEKILPGLQELGFDDIVIVDPNGNPVDAAKAGRP